MKAAGQMRGVSRNERPRKNEQGIADCRCAGVVGLHVLADDGMGLANRRGGRVPRSRDSGRHSCIFHETREDSVELQVWPEQGDSVFVDHDTR
jgi:hypothetical protein